MKDYVCGEILLVGSVPPLQIVFIANIVRDLNARVRQLKNILVTLRIAVGAGDASASKKF